MNGLNPNKSRGYDRMDPKIINVGATELAPSLAVILNRAIRNGEWIPKLKVIPQKLNLPMNFF